MAKQFLSMCSPKDTNKYVHNRLFVKPHMFISSMIGTSIMMNLYTELLTARRMIRLSSHTMDEFHTKNKKKLDTEENIVGNSIFKMIYDLGSQDNS